MTELDKLKRAKMYIDKLANGINPLDDTYASETDVINNVRLSRCFFYVSDILRQVIENGGEINAKSAKKEKKQPFFLPLEKLEQFPFSDEPISVSEIAKRLNGLADDSSMKKITYKNITEWLVSAGLLEVVTIGGSDKKRPTAYGNEIGIITEERTGKYGNYTTVVYNTKAQQFVLDNLYAIIAPTEFESAAVNSVSNQWSDDDGKMLCELMNMGVSTLDAARILGKSEEEINERLKPTDPLDDILDTL